MKISPIILKTDNIAKSLKEIAYQYKIPTAKLDFRLLEYQTMLKTPELKDWAELDEDNQSYIDDPQKLIDDRVDIKQNYEIEVFTNKEHPLFKYVHVLVGANKEKSKVAAVFEKGSKLKYSQKIEDMIRDDIQKKMLKAGYLIGLFDKKEELDRLFAKIKVSGAFIFKQKVQVIIAQGIPSQPSIDGNLIFHYQKQAKNIDQYDRMDYSRRGYALAVNEGDVIIEYIKPKQGTNGRACNGRIIKAHEPEDKNAPDFNITKNIEKKENEDSIEYIAKTSGYVVLNDNTYDIGDELEVGEVNFKSTGSIETGIDKDVKINVKEKDDFKDAIGTGMRVEAQQVFVEGSVASSARVTAQLIKIGGQTHQSSKLFADKIEINVHKGYAKGKNIHVTRLERGIIEADEVTIGQAIGGEVRAKKIYVEILNSNTKLYASDDITVEHVKGEDNSFIIDPMEIESHHDAIEKIEEGIAKLKDEYEQTNEKYVSKKNYYERNKAAIEQIKQQLAGYKAKGVKPPATFIHRIKQYQKLNDDLNSLAADVSLLKNDIDHKKEELDKIQSTVFHARITNKDKFSGHNEIIFKLISPKQEFRKVPSGSGKRFRIAQEGDEYVIKEESLRQKEEQELD